MISPFRKKSRGVTASLISAYRTSSQQLDRWLEPIKPAVRRVGWHLFLRPWAGRSAAAGDRLINGFSLTEKIIFSALLAALVSSSAVLVWQVNEQISATLPAAGGSFTEGIIGSPRFINPVLAVSDADHDLTSLVYSGPVKRLPNGQLAYDLAEQITVSEDATVFTVTLKDNATFHDGNPVTARDLAFTVEQIKNPEVRSPIHGNWTGVGVEIIDEKTVRFELSEPYAPFLENLTIGILPAHLWNDLRPSQLSASPYNDITPIGSGPYRVTDFSRDTNTALTEYTLTAFADYISGEPYISSIAIRSFANEQDRLEALRQGDIDSAGGLNPEAGRTLANDGREVKTAFLPRIFGVFFNTEANEVLSQDAVRQALDAAIDKEELVDQVLAGYGAPVDSPAPAGLILDHQSTRTTTTSTSTDPLTLLEEAGWSRAGDGSQRDEDGTKLAFTIRTSNTPELSQSARFLQDSWRELGIEAAVEIYSTNDLNQDVIRGRDYQALLFGMIIGPERDFYPFWHSSQRNDPGLNIAGYTNPQADQLLEEARATVDREERAQILEEFLRVARDDNSALFLYTPEYIYTPPPQAKNTTVGPVNTAHNRFATIHQWHINTKRRWLPFVPDTQQRQPTLITQY